MPSVDQIVTISPVEMATVTNSLEVFDKYKPKEDKESDEESFHLPLDDDEPDTKASDSGKNSSHSENDVDEEDILNKFDTTSTSDNIDIQLEAQLLNGDDDVAAESHAGEKDEPDSLTTEKSTEEKENESIDAPPAEETMEEDTIKPTSPKPNEEEDKSKELDPDQSSPSTTTGTSNSDSDSHSDQQQINLRLSVDGNDSTESNDQTSEETNKEDTNDPAEADKQTESAEKDPDVEETVEAATEETPEQNASEPEAKSAMEQENKDSSDDDTPKNHTEDSEELFDISIIRDVAEDNAENALDELKAAESQLHNEENFDYEDNNEKIDEIEDDAHSDKVSEGDVDLDRPDADCGKDEMDIEETSLKLDSEIQTEIEENKDDTVKENEEDACDQEMAVEAIEEQIQIAVDKSSEAKITATVVQPTVLERDATENRKSLKRGLVDDGDVQEDAAKKFKSNDATPAAKVEPALRSLHSLADFMKTRKLNRRLTTRDLEEFCVQKICEVLVHNSDVGDVNHQLKLQEQQIETMRKEIQQLTKQCKDLETVNRKLLSDLKQQNPTDSRTLNPLKITRSVGLQVKIIAPVELPQKRKPLASTPQKAPPQISPVKSVRNIPLNTISTPSPTRQVSVPILPQLLSNPKSNDAADSSSQNSRQKSIEPKPAAASVIDLTDEDDKTGKNKISPAKLIGTKGITVPLRTTPVRVNAQGLRLATTQTPGKNGTITTSPHQVMYVVHSTAANALNSTLGSKAVVVNFQSANILSSALNGSSVSVLPKQSVQLKTLTTSKPLQTKVSSSIASSNTNNINKNLKIVKHPAPLPSPPTTRLIDTALKPIPPKPFLTIRKTDTGIILQWKMPYDLEMYEVIASYQLYAYQETSALPSTEMWRKVGDVKALALPMACTLTQFADKNKYYFAVRPVDIHKRIGVFSDPEEISL